MLNLKQQVRGSVPDCKGVENTESTSKDRAIYQVGMTDQGQTQVAFNSVDHAVTVTLNAESVVHLIRLLAVNLDPFYTVTVTKNETV